MTLRLRAHTIKVAKTRSQDASLKRCFGKDEKIANCDWDYLSSLKTTREPHVGMPRLDDLLEWLTRPGIELVWLLLDVKVSLIPRTKPPHQQKPIVTRRT